MRPRVLPQQAPVGVQLLLAELAAVGVRGVEGGVLHTLVQVHKPVRHVQKVAAMGLSKLVAPHHLTTGTAAVPSHGAHHVGVAQGVLFSPVNLVDGKEKESCADKYI